MTDLKKALAALPATLADMKRLRDCVDVSRGRVVLSADEVTAKPYVKWNAFIALLGTLPFDRMTLLQQWAHLAFFYDGEVQNGGHLQFFLNKQDRLLVISALAQLSLPSHAELLVEAERRWSGRPRRAPTTPDEFSALAFHAEFADIDARYHELKPSISQALQSLLASQPEEFVVTIR